MNVRLVTHTNMKIKCVQKICCSINISGFFREEIHLSSSMRFETDGGNRHIFSTFLRILKQMGIE